MFLRLISELKSVSQPDPSSTFHIMALAPMMIALFHDFTSCKMVIFLFLSFFPCIYYLESNYTERTLPH